MQRYTYKAIDEEGKPHKGESYAKDQSSLAEELRAQGIRLIEAKMMDAASATALPSQRGRSLGAPVSGRVLALFTRQASSTLAAGLSLLRTMEILCHKNPDKTLRKVLEQLCHEIRQGASFSDALSRFPDSFGPMYVNLVKVGEVAGTLPATMAKLAGILEREQRLARKIRAATSYPAFVLGFTLLLCYVVLAFGVPILTPTFASAGLNIPRDYPLTAMFMKLSKWINQPWIFWAIIVLVVGSPLLRRLLLRQRPVRTTIDWLMLAAPVVGGLVRKLAAARFAGGFGMMLQAGVPLLQSLQIVGGTVGNVWIQLAVEKSAEELKSGGTLNQALEKSNVFPAQLTQMIRVGEEAGTLPEMLERVSAFFEDDVDTEIEIFTSMLEPLMMIIIGSVVCTFIIAVGLPILSMAQVEPS